MHIFFIKCTSAKRDYIKVGKIYKVINGYFVDENGTNRGSRQYENYHIWYENCLWTDFTFEKINLNKDLLSALINDEITSEEYKQLKGEE